ncbi:HDOD domain-containing protein [Pontibacterium sp.]|uniref:HDOD domain-containing protein n=1 Tax=Pontibacterium sp. TaxID=2036026 RepID=UPI003513033A
MSLQESPQDLGGWIHYLKDKTLPVRGSVKQRLLQAVESDATTLQTLCNLIKSDPVVCLHLVRVANKLHSEKGSAVTSIEHAVHSLGFDRIQQTIEQLELIRLNAGSVSHKLFFRSTANSHHASIQVREWLKGKGNVFAEELQLAALLYGIGHWMMWLHAPLHMSLIHQKIREKDVDVVLAETDVLGCTIQQISHDLAMEWGLPELVIESLDHETSPGRDIIDLMHRRSLKDPTIDDEERRELNHLVQQKYFPVKLSNWLAITAAFGWRQKKTKQLSMIISDYLCEHTAEVVGKLHQNCATAARIYNVPGTLSHATELIMLESDLVPSYKITPKELKSVVIECPRPSVEQIRLRSRPEEQEIIRTAYAPVEIEFKNEELFKKLAVAFIKGSPKIKTQGHVLQCIHKALADGLGMRHVTLHRVHNSQMATALSSGLPKDNALASYRFDLEIPSIFKRLCDKPGYLWITPQTREKTINALPESYHSFIPESGAILMSLFDGDQPVAIVHADNRDHAIDDFHNKRTRYIYTAAGQAFKNLTTSNSMSS